MNYGIFVSLDGIDLTLGPKWEVEISHQMFSDLSPQFWIRKKNPKETCNTDKLRRYFMIANSYDC